MTDYRAFLSKSASDGPGDAIADVAVDVIKNVCSAERLYRLTGGDPAGINDAIDAQLDRLIVSSDGDTRLAMFNLATIAGEALTRITGRRP